jgi:hypothetical protein
MIKKILPVIRIVSKMFHMQDQEVKEDDYLEVDPETNESDKPQDEDDNFYFR